ncbi:MAG: hypothetical protein WC539_11045 [Nitrospirota bacterium]
MSLSQEQQKKILIVLFVVLVLLILYRWFTNEEPKTAPLTYTQGAVAKSPVRPGVSRGPTADPLSVFFQRREEKYPGTTRDIFRMENPVPKPKVVVITPPPPPEKTPEEIAAEQARIAAEQARIAAEQARAAAQADMKKILFLGFLTDKEKTLFLSKDGENFMIKAGHKIKNYTVKNAGTDHVILFDPVTQVEVRIELAGAGGGSDQRQSHRPYQHGN